MHIFSDESGTFAVGAGETRVSCVAVLVVPDGQVEELRAEFRKLRETWPDGDGEVKGSALTEAEIAQVVELAARYEAVLMICAIDSGRHTTEQLRATAAEQAEKIRRSVTPGVHDPNLVRQVRGMAAGWEGLPLQLVAQLYVTVHVIGQVLKSAPTYFAQRMPADLGSFHFYFDAKDLKKTPYEKLWERLVLPFLKFNSMRDPFMFVEGLDYSPMARFRVNEDHLDLGALLRGNVHFERSHENEGLQIVDVLANAFTRAMNGRLGVEGWGDLGRLVIGDGDPAIAFVELVPTGQPQTIELTDAQQEVLRQIYRKAKRMLV